jgi:hypothetical protein
MLRCVALVRTDFSEKLSGSVIRVTRIGELGKTLAVTSNRRKRRPEEFFVSNSLDVKEHYEQAVDFAPPLSRLFQFRKIWAFLSNSSVVLILPCSIACIIIVMVSLALFSDICKKYDVHSLSDPLQNRIKPDTRLQIKKT